METTTEMEKERTEDVLGFGMPAESLKTIVRLLSDSVGTDKILITANEKAIRFAGVDRDNVSLACVYVNMKDLRNPRVSGPQAFAIEPDRLRLAFKPMKKDQLISFTRKENKVRLNVGDFLNIFDTAHDEVVFRLPEIDYPKGGLVDAKQLHEAMETMGEVSDRIYFQTEENRLVMSAKENGETVVEQRLSLAKNSFDDGIKVIVNTKRLRQTVKAIKDSEEIMLRYRTNHPMKISFRSGILTGYMLIAPMHES